MRRSTLPVFVTFFLPSSLLSFSPGPPARLIARRRLEGAVVRAASEFLEGATTDLPDSFDTSVSLAVQSTLASKADGWLKLRVDFDTSQGDETYTKLKSSMPFTQKFVAQIVPELLAPAGDAGDADGNLETKKAEAETPQGTVRLYFPDAGSAALAQRDWKVGTAEALVPQNVRFASLSRDLPEASDGAIIFICPRASEVDFLKVVLKKVEELDLPLIFINPGRSPPEQIGHFAASDSSI